MIIIKKEGIVLKSTALEFENKCVLNPAVIRKGDCVHIFYRAVSKGNRSSIGYCKLDGPVTVTVRWEKPIIISELAFELQGVEDPRISEIDNLYYLSYTGYDGTNAHGLLATSHDLVSFEKQGHIVPLIEYEEFVSLIKPNVKVNPKYYQYHDFYYQTAGAEKRILLWDKNVVFFPRRIKDKLVFLHRIRPGIQIVSVNSLKQLTKPFWTDYFQNFHEHVILDPIYEHESSYIGAGCPPIETEQGWLLIYHAVRESPNGLIYTACAALLDLEDPSKELARLPYILFSPEFDWELYGEVNNVVFPTGTAIFGNTLFIYYGAADAQIACASVNLSDLVAELLTYTVKTQKIGRVMILGEPVIEGRDM